MSEAVVMVDRGRKLIAHDGSDHLSSLEWRFACGIIRPRRLRPHRLCGALAAPPRIDFGGRQTHHGRHRRRLMKTLAFAVAAAFAATLSFPGSTLAQEKTVKIAG